MDFIKNLSLSDKYPSSHEEHEQKLESPPPPPPTAIEGPRHESLLDKIGSAFGNNSGSAPPPSQPVPVAHPQTTSTIKEEHGLVGKITSALGRDNEPAAPPAPTASVLVSTQDEPGHAHKLAHKISGMFDSAEERERKAAEAAALAKAQEEARLKAEEEARKAAEEEERRHRYHPHHILEKMGLGQEHEAQTAAVPPPAKGQESILDKLGLKHDEPAPPPPPKDESLLDKIGSTFGHKRVEEPPKPQTLGEKIQATLHHAHGEEEKKNEEKDGRFMNKLKVALGGEEEEVDEDALDKAIDLVQEHILHQGPQKDEGFLEKLKDEQLAKAIRKEYANRTGHEFPIKKN